MAEQNINQYVYKKYRLNLVSDSMDMSLASDERDFYDEVIFSPYLIAETYGNKLPINIDINNPLTVQNLNLIYKNFNPNNIFVSQNVYNPKNENLIYFSSTTLCDIGLTGIDNGLTDKMYNETLTFTKGLYDDSLKFSRSHFDRRFKMIQVTGYTGQYDKFDGVPDYTLYEVVKKVDPYAGNYHELYGGFYQGFYKLFGYDYDTMPERTNKGWSVEMVLKPRLVNEYFPSVGETTLNEIYPQNKNTFFYLGTRAENKFYHHADGTPNCFTGYTRVTTPLSGCLQTCACCDSSVKNSNCVFVYPPRSIDGKHDNHVNYGCSVCNGDTSKKYYCGCDCGDEPCGTCGWECQTHSCPDKVVAFQICNSNGEIDDNFDVYLNGTYVGNLVFSSSTVSGGIFVGTNSETANFTENGFYCQNDNMDIFVFNKLLINEGQNQIFLQNTQNNNNGNYGSLDIKTYNQIGNSLFNPNNIEFLFYNGPSGTDFTFNFLYYPNPTPTPTPTPLPTPTEECNIPTPTCTPTCTNCVDCTDCIDCTTSGNTSIEDTCERDPFADIMSNNISFKLCGDVKNPQIGIKVLRLTGGCETTGTSVTGLTYVTGYTIQEWCTPPIYDRCLLENPAFLDVEHWFLVDVVWERNSVLDECDLIYKGGLGDITQIEFLESLANNTVSLIKPPYTNGKESPKKIELINLNEKWLDNKKYRKGTLKVYVNGKLHYKIEDFEEVIPRGLNTEKEKQLGVPFNISWGGGTQGLHENLTFSSCTTPNSNYIQDPECFPTSILNNSSLSGLKTNIVLEEEFGGTFEGGVSQFRMYIEPLNASEIRHNFNILKSKFRLFDPFCPDCSVNGCKTNDFTYAIFSSLTETIETFSLGREYKPDERDKKYLIKNNIQKITTKSVPSVSTTSKFWNCDGWWGNQGSLPQCVGYSWAHWLEDGPVEQSGIPPIIHPSLIYKEAQKIDEWVGENYDGTSVRAGAKYLQSKGKIKSYYWAFDLTTLINTVLKLGPVVVGTNWYNGMFYPDRNGVIRVTGRYVGGHAYVINGVDMKTKQFRIKNSWGKNWGKVGLAYISFNDMGRLIKENGEVCIATEISN